ncbi:MAG: cache domain-containing protein [Desulfobacteraceae bacterium]|nr:cache domain-containing protein [Desulfobacteraceae bacterium]
MKTVAVSVLFLVLLAGGVSCPFAQERATPKEVVQKVTEACDFLKEKGVAELQEFNQRDGRWVWKDSYVFVVDTDTVRVLAHPITPQLLGRTMIGLKDIKGNFFFIQFCEKVRKDGEGWVEYWWPKPGQSTPSRKITYISHIPGTSLMAGAGVYDEQVSLDELNNLKN